MARQNSNGSPATQPPPLTPAILEKFLTVQQQELQVRAEEAAIKSKQDDHNKVIAEASIAASLQDRSSERNHQYSKTKILFIGSGSIVAIVLIFMGFALSIGKEAIVMKALELITTFIAGFVGGYGFNYARNKDKTNPPE